MLSHNSMKAYLVLMLMLGFFWKKFSKYLGDVSVKSVLTEKAQNLQFIIRAPLAENIYLQDLK